MKALRHVTKAKFDMLKWFIDVLVAVGGMAVTRSIQPGWLQANRRHRDAGRVMPKE